MKKFFRSIYNFFSKKKVNEENKPIIPFMETFQMDYVKSLLRYIAYDLHNTKGEKVLPLRLNDYYSFSKAYFAGRTLCMDIEVDGRPFNTLTLNLDSIGWFNPNWENGVTDRVELGVIEQQIYKEIYKMVKGKEFENE